MGNARRAISVELHSSLKLTQRRPNQHSWAAVLNAPAGCAIGPANAILEPPSAADPLLQAPEDKTLFSPHIAGMSPESGRRIMMMSAENIARALTGQDPLYVVNPVQLREASNKV
jgi:hypothetical protein